MIFGFFVFSLWRCVVNCFVVLCGNLFWFMRSVCYLFGCVFNGCLFLCGLCGVALIVVLCWLIICVYMFIVYIVLMDYMCVERCFVLIEFLFFDNRFCILFIASLLVFSNSRKY